MTGWLIFLGVLVVIAILPVGAALRYDEAGAEAKLIVGPVRIRLFPRPEKKQKAEKNQKKGKNQKKEKKSAAKRDIPDGPPEGAPTKDLPKPKKGGSLADFLPLVDVALDMLSSLRRKLRVNFLQLRLTMAADDPCDLAVNYGRAQAAGAGLLAQLERFLVIRKRDVQIQCDFTADEMKILARVELTIPIGRLLSWAVVYGVKALITYLKINHKREGGAAL